jgi:RNA polymerase sigma-70 factor (ECF subfamily)
MREESDQIWIETVTALFEEHHAAVCAYLYSLVDEWELARDLTQETFLELFYTRHRLRDVENQRAWIYRIATHLALNRLKRQRRFAWLPWSSSGQAFRVEWHFMDAEVEHRTQIEEALAALPPHFRAPLLLYSYYGFSVREVAELLNLTEGNVKVQLYRARTLFRQSYAAAMGLQEDSNESAP